MPVMSGTIIKNLFSGPATRPYPVVKRKPFPATRARVIHEPERCSHCGLCVNLCPTEALHLEENREMLTITRTYNSFACIYCGRCVEICPEGALRIGLDYPEAADQKTVVSTRK